MLAAAVMWLGKSDLKHHTIELLGLATLASIDLWVWVLKWKSLWKYVFGWGGMSLFLLIVSLTIWWGINDKLEVERNEVKENLFIGATLPPGLASPLGSFFQIVNKGKTDIDSGYKIVCEINYMMADHIVIKSNPPHDPTFSHVGKVADAVLSSGGGSDSVACLSDYIYAPDFRCADVTIKVMYFVEGDMRFKQEKSGRFATGRNGTSFQWYPKNTEDSSWYCLEMEEPKTPQHKGAG